MEQPNSELRRLIERLRAGDTTAWDELLVKCQERLRLLTHRMLRHFHRLLRWEETDDVLQNALLRLLRALNDPNVQAQMTSPEVFLRLAATIIRRELIDLARHYFGPYGHGSHAVTPPPDAESTPRPVEPAAGSSSDPDKLINWEDFHKTINDLPDENRWLFDLIWYHGLKQEEVAELVGMPLRTLKRHWRASRNQVIKHYKGESPF